ncbi:MAG: YggT family protein [Actinomycetota bacterium]
MNIILVPLLTVLYYALDIYWYIVLGAVIMSWLKAFGVVNAYNQAVRVIDTFLARLTEPALWRIRRVLPDFGPVDVSPIALWLIIMFLKMVVMQLLMTVQRY